MVTDQDETICQTTLYCTSCNKKLSYHEKRDIARLTEGPEDI